MQREYEDEYPPVEQGDTGLVQPNDGADLTDQFGHQQQYPHHPYLHHHYPRELGEEHERPPPAHHELQQQRPVPGQYHGQQQLSPSSQGYAEHYQQQPYLHDRPPPSTDAQGYYDPRQHPGLQHQQQFMQQEPSDARYYDHMLSDPGMYERYSHSSFGPPQQQYYEGPPGHGSSYSVDWEGNGQQYNGDMNMLYYQQQQPPMMQHPQAHPYQNAMMADMSGPSRALSYVSGATSLPPHPSESQPSAASQATPESIEEYRQKAKRSNDPQIQFDFAKFLIEVAATAPDPTPDDPKASRKYKEALLSEGLKWIKRLASQGIGLGRVAYPEAQFFLANCYGNGSLGLPVDHDKAFSLYFQASKQSHASATYRTAVCYELGAGTKRDHARAVQFYRKAAALGGTAAMYKLGMILLNGLLGQQKNPREAITWLKRASAVADEENPHALHELGLCYEKAGIPNLIPDEAHARELFTKAAQLGYAPSQFKMGCCYEYGTLTCPVDPRRSIYWYTRAAEQGDPESELALSGWYLTGAENVLKQSDTEAYLWARKAADKGLAKAEYAVGYYSEVGIGVKQDLEEAKRWYMRAAAQGNKRAMQRLTDLKRMGSGTRRVKPEKHTRGQDGDCTIS